MEKRAWSVLLAFALLASLLPWAALPARAEGPTVYTSYSADASDGGDCWVDGAYENLVDNDKSTKWGCSFNGTRYVDFHSAAPIVPTGYVLTTGADAATSKGRNPKDWKIYAKKTLDAAEWTVLAEVTNDATMEDIDTKDYSFTLANSEAWQYFRFEVSAVRGNPNDPSDHTFQLAELQFTVAGTHDLASASIEGLQASYPYTGEDIELAYTVKAADGTVLSEGTDYDAAVSPSPVRAVGDYTLTLTGKGGYSGTKTASFSVVGQETAPSRLESGDTVWFGKQDNAPVAWRVLSPAGDDTLPVSGAAQNLLVAEYLMGETKFAESSNAWAGSAAQSWCASLYENWPAGAERDAIAATSAEEAVTYSYAVNDVYYKGASLNAEHFFFLSAEEADRLFADNEARKAYASAEEKKTADSGRNWWLRSPSTYGNMAGGVGPAGALQAFEYGNEYSARPAFNLSASAILLASAVNGKSGVTGTFAPLPENGTHEWKLTLRDKDRTGFTVTETEARSTPGGTLRLHYAGAKTGSGEYVSALLYDVAGELVGYASVSVDAASGTAVYRLPEDLKPGGYTLRVFNEKRADGCASDLAGNDVTLSLTLRDTDAVVLEPGDTVWFGIREQRTYTDVSNVTEYKPVAWRVLSPAGDETLPVSDAAHALLISRNTLGYGIAYGAFSETVPDPWYVSSAKDWCDDLFTYWDTSEQDAIAKTSLPDNETYRGGFNNLFEYDPAPLRGEHFFFLSAEEADTYFNGDDDRVAYRADEHSSAADRKDTTDWWLRSPVRSASSAVQGFATPAAGAVSGSGWVSWACTGGQTPMCYDARPAFNLDMSRVFFATAARGGKASSDGSFVPMENTTHEWKLTLRHDVFSGIALAETAATAFVGGRVPLHYSGVPDMGGMSVSALLYDENGERVGYASVSAETASGTAAFTLPGDLKPGAYQLKVFSELRFSDYRTDLAGSAVTVDLTVLPAPSVEGGTLSGQMYELGYTVKNAPEGALLIGALYDGSGHLREVQTVSVSGDVQDSFYMRNVKDPVSVLMLVDSKTYAPLCPAWRSKKA